MKTVSPFGSWHSPITSENVIGSSLKLSSLHIDDGYIYYIEGRPKEKGRSVLMKIYPSQEKTEECLIEEYSVRTKVHEYGGKCYTCKKGEIYFVNGKNQAIYHKSSAGDLSLFFEKKGLRFADLELTSSFLYVVVEDLNPSQESNYLARICLKTKTLEILARGYDFYAAPRVSPDGSHLAFFCWNHPNMPWDGSELYTLSLNDFTMTLISGGIEESITHPMWDKNNVLYFVSDKTGWWNLYKYHEKSIKPLYPVELEFGAAHWIFGVERYCFLPDGKLAAIGTKKGIDSLYILDVENHTLEKLDTPFTALSDLYYVDHHLIFMASSPSVPSSIFSYHLSTRKITALKSSSDFNIEKDFIPEVEAISFKTEGALTCYGFYYPPTHPHFSGNMQELPPLILRCHGGPTTHTPPRFNMETLYFTSRGFAVFEINYGGSTGYGRLYRNRLRRNWGVVDAYDCINAAHHLIKNSLVDPKKLIIKGSSAGGYTVLQALSQSQLFSIGVCYYAVSDLEALLKDTHKFEAHYLDHLIGPYPEDKKTYVERSPIHHSKKISTPIIFFQGQDDTVVFPSQSEKMYQALQEKKIPVAYYLFENESHGFRNAETLKKCIEEELSFYKKHLLN